ncbi:hypothetical protein JXM67_14100 [candidate division WOR-3 bacterium]|nr:hypothetical protein [candidate division WOR-3 bacterium]
MTFGTLLGIWIAATLTIAIFSFLYRDNPLYKFAEHLYVGVSAAYWVVTTAKFTMQDMLVDVFITNWKAYQSTGSSTAFWEAMILIIPTILGIMMLTRWFGPKVNWISRWPIAFTVGLGAGLGITGAIQGFLLPQVQATLLPIWEPGISAAAPISGPQILIIVSNIVLIVGVIGTLIFFYFSRPHTGILGVGSRSGIVFIMIGFGAAFGYTVMARISLLIGRLDFLVNTWIGGTIRFIQDLVR